MTKLRTWIRSLTGLVVVGVAAFWILSAPQAVSPDELPTTPGDPEGGREIFLIGGCASCHAAPKAEGDERLVLSGGKHFDTAFGIFVAPNISSDPEAGIGGWSALEFASAMLRGVSPDGQHYYPAFPYASYARMKPEDVMDLWAYMQTLPPSNETTESHKIGFPFNIRRGLGLWKRLYVDDDAKPVVPLARSNGPLERGRYLVEGPGHCGECHTSRNAIGGLDRNRWLAGAPSPEGKGRIPNITPGGKKIGDWSSDDIAYYLETGFTPDFDSAGGAMVDVIANTSQISDADRAAIAAYLKAIPPVQGDE